MMPTLTLACGPYMDEVGFLLRLGEKVTILVAALQWAYESSTKQTQ